MLEFTTIPKERQDAARVQLKPCCARVKKYDHSQDFLACCAVDVRQGAGAVQSVGFVGVGA